MSLRDALPSVDVSRELFVSLGAPGLFAVAFFEFFLLPVPPDLVLVPLSVANPEFALGYAAVATAGSVSAGLVGHAIGRRGGRPVLRSRFSEERVDRAEAYFEEHGLATLLVGAFAPIPEGYEVLSILSGAADLDRRVFVLASVAGRGGRYFLEALLAVALGEAARSLTEVEVYSVLGVVTLAVLCSYALLRYVRPRVRRSAGT